MPTGSPTKPTPNQSTILSAAPSRDNLSPAIGARHDAETPALSCASRIIYAKLRPTRHPGQTASPRRALRSVSLTILAFGSACSRTPAVDAPSGGGYLSGLGGVRQPAPHDVLEPDTAPPPPAAPSSIPNSLPAPVADISGDLALLATGAVCSVTNGETMSWPPLTRIAGDSKGGCGIDRQRKAFCWSGGRTDETSDTITATLGQVSDIAGSSEAGCAIRENGAVICWDQGEPEPPDGPYVPGRRSSTTPRDTPPAALRFVPMGVANATSIAGGRQACVIQAGGQVSCWGWRWTANQQPIPVVYNRRSIRVPGLSGIRQLAASLYAKCAIDSGGAVLCWGQKIAPSASTGAWYEAPFDSTPRRVLGIASAKQVSLGASTACAITTTGQVWCWGAESCSDSAPTSEPTALAGIHDAVRIALSFGRVCIVHGGGTLDCRKCSAGFLRGLHDQP